MEPYEYVAEVHANCAACAIMTPPHACLSHTCPDCGSTTFVGVDPATGEALHRCPL